MGVAGSDLSVPVEGETDFVQLFAIACNVFDGRHRGVLSGLNGILFGGKAVGIIAHGVKDVESFQAFVACVDVGGDVAERMTDMKSRS